MHKHVFIWVNTNHVETFHLLNIIQNYIIFKIWGQWGIFEVSSAQGCIFFVFVFQKYSIIYIYIKKILWYIITNRFYLIYCKM